jgi:hypothetical protein
MRALLLLIVALLLVGCGAQPDDFVGSWENINDPKTELHITRRGDDAFVVRNAAGTNFDAEFKDGQLRVVIDETPITLTYDPSKDQLLRGKTSFKRRQ